MHAVEQHHHDEQYRKSDQVVNEIRNRNGNWKDFRRDDRLCDQRRIVRYRVAIAHDRVTEQKPWQEAAKEKNRETVCAEFRSKLGSKDYCKYEGVTDEGHERMNHR